MPRSSRGNLCDPSLALFLKCLGFPFIEVDDFDKVAFPDGKIIATPFFEEYAALDIRAKSTYWIPLGGKSVGADSSGLDPVLYRYVRWHLGRVDIAFLGMEREGAPMNWKYQPLFSQQRHRVGAKEVYIYAVGKESWLGHVMAASYNEYSYQLQQIVEFEERCSHKGVKSGHLRNQAEWYRS
ncbi:hypothetical protein [Streptomyces sp. NPDC017638]|uniref:hypothetical protein n=1 Tax=Streptomyces sp. NPDC017638 TaxID=3365004 RepID=UPI0037BD6B80